MIFDGSPALANFSVTQALGKSVLCEDGKWRRVQEIVPAHGFPWRSIINENDPDSKSGHFVNNFVLAAIVLGQPLPDKDAIEAAIRAWKALDYNEPTNRQQRRQMERRLTKRPGRLHLT